MSESKFGELWHKKGKQGIRTADETFIGDAYRGPADRIVACVNAFAGTPYPAAELARLRKIEKAALAAKGGE